MSVANLKPASLSSGRAGFQFSNCTARPHTSKTYSRGLLGPEKRLCSLRCRLPSSTYLNTSRQTRRPDAHSCRVQAAVQTDDSSQTIQSCKLQLQEELEGTKRGIFGLKASKSEAIEALLHKLESTASQQCPTQHMSQLGGTWHLLYTSLVIKGARKTKLGLREFVSLGNFEQIIDPDQQAAAISAKRVQINFESAKLVPKALEQLFAGNYDLLLSIFNPEGWLDITYFDDMHRIGRDDKGNVFYLQRA